MYASLFAVGNACATIVLARWDNALQKDVLDEVLNKPKSS
ncbi:sodium:dicarboxylate symporter [Acinetobacter johnsonii]|nr:sodium:dicarboxylate symporter [Acinetobacter johnsonii]UJA06046.1 sodium:dicarboxylate symporter [Acinetobacter johnsonii]